MKNGTTSLVEVTNISTFGIWLLVNEKEYFLPYSEFHWFKNATVNQIINVEEISQNHFFWEDLDVDLSLKMIENPGNYPLTSK